MDRFEAEQARRAAGVHVEFYSEPRENKRKTREQGRPIFEDKEFVRIRFPADNKRVHVAPAQDVCGNDPETGRPFTYADKYPIHYKAFKELNGDAIIGTPLSEAPFLTRSRIMELKALHIQTVEQLADLDERNFKNVGMDARSLRDKAVAWLDDVEGNSALSKQIEENNALRARLEALEKHVMAEGVDAKPEPVAEEVEDDEDAETAKMTEEFKGWDKETLLVFLKENTDEKIPAKATKDNLVKLAVKTVKAKIAAKKVAA